MAKSWTIGISSLQQGSGGLGEVRSKAKAKSNAKARLRLRLRLRLKAQANSPWDDPATSFSPWGSAAAGGGLVNPGAGHAPVSSPEAFGGNRRL